MVCLFLRVLTGRLTNSLINRSAGHVVIAAEAFKDKRKEKDEDEKWFIKVGLITGLVTAFNLWWLPLLCSCYPNLTNNNNFHNFWPISDPILTPGILVTVQVGPAAGVQSWAPCWPAGLRWGTCWGWGVCPPPSRCQVRTCPPGPPAPDTTRHSMMTSNQVNRR